MLLLDDPLGECDVDVADVFDAVVLAELLLSLTETVARTELTPLTLPGVFVMPELDLRLESGGVRGPPGDNSARSPSSADAVWAAGVHCLFFSASEAAIFLFVLIVRVILSSRFFSASSCRNGMAIQNVVMFSDANQLEFTQ